MPKFFQVAEGCEIRGKYVLSYPLQGWSVDGAVDPRLTGAISIVQSREYATLIDEFSMNGLSGKSKSKDDIFEVKWLEWIPKLLA